LTVKKGTIRATPQAATQPKSFGFCIGGARACQQTRGAAQDVCNCSTFAAQMKSFSLRPPTECVL
jgi:hypothetical protein